MKPSAMVRPSATIFHEDHHFSCHDANILEVNKNSIFQAKHAEGGNSTWGINGETGGIADMKELGVWDCYSVKAQTYKTAVEVGYRHNIREIFQNLSNF